MVYKKSISDQGEQPLFLKTDGRKILDPQPMQMLTGGMPINCLLCAQRVPN